MNDDDDSQIKWSVATEWVLGLLLVGQATEWLFHEVATVWAWVLVAPLAVCCWAVTRLVMWCIRPAGRALGERMHRAGHF